jgi:Zn-dependent protease with chaperone function
MDFFEAQDRARRRTHVLVGFFAAAVLGIVLAVYLVVMVAGGLSLGMTPGFDPALFAVVALGTGTLIGLGSAFRTSQLRRGGPAVAELLGGRPVSHDTEDPLERRLVNVVEEMAVASGTPVPAVYVLPGEDSINAFAAGYGIHDAAVAFTRGSLERLSRDELQGVVAHEFSHVLNGDMRLNIRLVGLLFGILLLAVVGRGILRGGMMSRRSRDGRAALLGMALVVLGYIGVFFGKLIKAAVSRQREFLADAAAVQFTRNPDGIAGALKKIGAHSAGSRIRDHHAEELSHLFFADGVGAALSRATSTHPPLQERIRRIDPSWDGDFGTADPVSLPERPARARPERAPIGVSGGLDGARALTDGPAGGVAAVAAILASIGAPNPEHVTYARRLLEGIPPELRDAAHDPVGARALLLALVGGSGPAGAEARRKVAVSLDGERLPAREGTGREGPSFSARLEDLLPKIERLPAEARLPLLDLALPALHRLEPADAAAFRTGVERVARADGEVRPFEFALLHVLWRHLPGAREPGRRAGPPLDLGSLGREVEVVLSAVARVGTRDEEAGGEAFLEGARTLFPTLDPVQRPLEQVGLGEVDGALERLERGTLEARRRVLAACAATILADAEVRPEEAELLRAVAECLELPLPPIIAPGGGATLGEPGAGEPGSEVRGSG